MLHPVGAFNLSLTIEYWRNLRNLQKPTYVKQLSMHSYHIKSKLVVATDTLRDADTMFAILCNICHSCAS
jgi:hypothetical protein